VAHSAERLLDVYEDAMAARSASAIARKLEE